LRSWYPLVLIPLTYKELGYLIPLIHPRDFDRELALVDQRMLGVDPIVWLDRINYPSLALIMQLSYLTYYVMPIVLGIVLWRTGRFREFQFFLFVIMLGFYVSYLGYIIVPAIGPRFFLDPNDVKPFSGAGVGAIRSVLDRMEGVTRDCFPSGHTELTLLVLFCAYQFHKKTFYVLLPIGSALIFSTVYLRYHYVIDVFAGAATALALALAARWLYETAGGVSMVKPDKAS
jgi:membrane-associated phospholipid phosphatase